MICPSYYCLYSLYNKIINKGRTFSAWNQGVGREREGSGEKEEGRGLGMEGEMTQTLHAHMNK
jgi:hypothetical protein